MVIAPTDRRRPVETTFAFVVEAGTPGLSIGRVERKMGQKVCPAAELVFEDCFLEESCRVSSEPLPGRRIDLVLGATRGAVGAFGAGVARGAYERALGYASVSRHEGRWLLDQQWAQMLLAEMLRNVMIARALYVSAMLENELFGLSRLMRGPAQSLERVLPRAILESDPLQRAVSSRAVTKAAQRGVAELPAWMVDASSAHGAAAKVTATDLAMTNCHLALDLMGADGLRRDRGVEKLYRDAKLLQIYEGTNQLNRIELFKKGVSPTPVPRARRGGER
ncbi:MAG: acyl-CoA dehydrogenase family protein [Sandaracinaceae bacterium]|nr:acyl-CoA dehydrogenase family protein [Sandaracinaceae bacterium]